MIPETVIKSARILVVDDEPAVVDVLVRFLEKAGYANVISATDPDTALRARAEHAPDLILLDLHMPGKDGFWLLERIHDAGPDDIRVPVIVLTGDGSFEYRRRALTNGARDVVVKPVDYVELMLRIWNLLETRFSFLRLAEEKRRLEEQLRKVGAGA